MIRGRLFVSFRVNSPLGLINLLMDYNNVGLVKNLTKSLACNKT